MDSPRGNALGEFPEGMAVDDDVIPVVAGGLLEGDISCKNKPPVLAGAAFMRKDAMVPLFLLFATRQQK
jgi:hypothetical protein